MLFPLPVVELDAIQVVQVQPVRYQRLGVVVREVGHEAVAGELRPARRDVDGCVRSVQYVAVDIGQGRLN